MLARGSGGGKCEKKNQTGRSLKCENWESNAPRAVTTFVNAGGAGGRVDAGCEVGAAAQFAWLVEPNVAF